MKIAYKAEDGTVFDNEEDAILRDSYYKEILEVIKPFDVSIESGKFIQRTKNQVDNLIDNTYKILVKYHGGKTGEIPTMWKKNPYGFVGRYLCDGSYPANIVYTYLLSIDKNNRQYNQPYYANEANREIEGK